MASTRYHTLRLLLGDQLNLQHSWFRQTDDGILYVLMEIRPEQEYVWHHVRKIQLFFSAMRHMAAALRQSGHQVRYFRLDDTDNRQSFEANCDALLAQHGITAFEYQLPDEYRLDVQLATYADALRKRGVAVAVADTEHFLTQRSDLAGFFAGKKQWLMERFYRHMRVRHNLLMDGAQPVGGTWNYDAENRNPPPGKGYVFPKRPQFGHQADEVVPVLNALGIQHVGSPLPDRESEYPVTRAQALTVLQDFIQHHLPRFGLYQDSMQANAPYLHHSLLSFPLNAKLISPLEVVQAVEAAYHAAPDRYPLPAVEGYIRQIIGWREYMRGIYWALMPDYALTNHLQAQTPLPQWYWTGHTRMRCLSQVIGQSLGFGYAHHIQRLMVTGNFATLIGARPADINAWYLGIYVDALEWVQLPNTHGMSQFADGGRIATKPYVSSAAYINRMTDYCRGCHYDPRERTGPRACPFNSLYWHFLARNEGRLGSNPRMGQMYANWRRQPEAQRKALLEQAEMYLGQLEAL